MEELQLQNSSCYLCRDSLANQISFGHIRWLPSFITHLGSSLSSSVDHLRVEEAYKDVKTRQWLP